MMIHLDLAGLPKSGSSLYCFNEVYLPFMFTLVALFADFWLIEELHAIFLAVTCVINICAVRKIHAVIQTGNVIDNSAPYFSPY
jgi:hypothetical protein